MTKDEALRLALDAFNKLAAWNDGEVGCHMDEPYSAEVSREAITAIKAALEAKDEPEYYGLIKDHLWMSISKEHYDRIKPEVRMACYTTPPQRIWVGLTDEEIDQAFTELTLRKIYQTIETKLRSKNT